MNEKLISYERKAQSFSFSAIFILTGVLIYGSKADISHVSYSFALAAVAAALSIGGMVLGLMTRNERNHQNLVI